MVLIKKNDKWECIILVSRVVVTEKLDTVTTPLDCSPPLSAIGRRKRDVKYIEGELRNDSRRENLIFNMKDAGENTFASKA